MSIWIFVITTFILLKFIYKRFEKEYGAKTWKLEGSRTGNFRVMGFLSFAITLVLMLILKNIVLH